MNSARSKIYCIMFTGASLSDAACEALYQGACDCVRDEKHERKIRHDDVTGVIYTDFDFGVLGSVNGIVFEGNIETEEGDSEVKYIIQTYELEKVRRQERFWHRMSFDEFLDKMNQHRWN